MSIRLLNLIIDADIPQSERLILIKLARHASQEGKRIFPSVATIASTAGLSTRQTQRILKTLRALGVVDLVCPGGRGAGSSNTYAFSLPILDRLCSDGWYTFVASHAQTAEPVTAQGDTRMSPSITQPRVTIAVRQGDTRCHTNRQEEGPRYKRERARKCSERGATSGTSATREPNAWDPEPSFASFQAAWPNIVASSQTKTRKAWDAISSVDRHAAIAGIQPFLESLKAAGRSFTPASQTYLAEQHWALIEAPREPSNAVRVLEAWSRDWWATMLGRVLRAEKVAFAFQQARAAQPITATVSEIEEARDAGPLLCVDPNGDDGEAWRAWWGSYGARLPDHDERFTLFAPAINPAQLAANKASR